MTRYRSLKVKQDSLYTTDEALTCWYHGLHVKDLRGISKCYLESDFELHVRFVIKFPIRGLPSSEFEVIFEFAKREDVFDGMQVTNDLCKEFTGSSAAQMKRLMLVDSIQVVHKRNY